MNKRDFGNKLFPSVGRLLAIAAPIMLGLVYASKDRAETLTQETVASVPSFEVASVKPGKPGLDRVRVQFTPDGFIAENTPLQLLVREAYRVKDDQISGLPSWAETENYDIYAKVDSADIPELKKLSFDERRSMLVPLLADRFKLKVHHESKDLPVYALVVAKSGSKLRETKLGDKGPDGTQISAGQAQAGVMFMGAGQISGQGVPITSLVKMLSGQNLGRTILDKTGLTGNYDFKLQWSSESGVASMFNSAQAGPQEPAPPLDSSGPSIFTAIQEQLGLKLESQKGPVDTIVIDHVERPSPN